MLFTFSHPTMKKTLVWSLLAFLALGLLASFVVHSTNDDPKAFYYAYSTKIPLFRTSDQVVIRYAAAPKSQQMVAAIIQKLAIGSRLQWQDDKTVIVATTDGLGLSALLGMSTIYKEVLTSQPLYKFASGASFAVTNEFNVKFLPKTTEEQIAALAERTGSTKLWSPVPGVSVMSVPKGGNALAIANLYQESGLVAFAHPNFLTEFIVHQAPNDTYYAQQFYLRNTGQQIADGHTGTFGADIKAENAWAITRGSSNITVAILDDGVSADHPDLPNTRQVRLAGSNFAGDGNANDPSPRGLNAHGNHCAGIVAATQNNGEGISGIAPLCRIMPLRIFNQQGNSDPNWQAAAITFAWQNGADVISNSWGSRFELPANNNPTVAQAIQDAVTQGRGRRGCVVTFSAGNTASHTQNNNGFVAYPANVTVINVLTVGASERTDHQADYSPSANPSSNNNQYIDLVAPSHRAYPTSVAGETFEVYSIDTQEPTTGLTGDNPWPATNPNGSPQGTIPPQIGEQLPTSGPNFLAYTARFGGTSAATPQVAGVAALLLSYYPTLTSEQVFRLLAQTADKVGGYAYGNAGRSNELGYGRLNAGAALNALCGQSTGLYSTQGVYSTYDNGTTLQSFQLVPTNQRYYLYVNQPYDFNFSAISQQSVPYPITKTGPQTAYFDFSGVPSIQVLATAPSSAPCSAQSSFVFRSSNSFRVAPNPASSELTVTDASAEQSVTSTNTDSMKAKVESFNADLYDIQGHKVRTQRSGHGKATLSVQDLPAGPYILRVGQGKGAHTEQVQISH
jgi:subtilisin family serine protease